VERQNATKSCLKDELEKLIKGEINPFNRKTEGINDLSYNGGSVSLIDSLRRASLTVSVSDVSRRDLKYLVQCIEKGLRTLNLYSLPLIKVTRRTIKQILEEISNTPDRFNKNRSNLMILFSEMCEDEIVGFNPVRDIRKKKVVKHLRNVLSDEERVKVNEFLKINYPSFHRFLHIFFHSGARISELLRIKLIDVDLPNQRYKVVIRKGRNYKEVWKTIKDIALPYWHTLYNECNSQDYLFSKGLCPGQIPIQPYQITKRWYRLVKKKLNIVADFYSLKHLHTTEVVEMLDEQAAAKHNEHTSTAMVVGIYDVQRVKREHNKIKGLNNGFA